MNMKILVFLHGTTIMHRNAKGLARESIVKQVMGGETPIHDYASYIPVGNAAKKLQKWRRQGARICYLSSHKSAKDVETDRSVLKEFGFPDGQVLYRRNREEYKNVVERIRPLRDSSRKSSDEKAAMVARRLYPLTRESLAHPAWRP